MKKRFVLINEEGNYSLLSCELFFRGFESRISVEKGLISDIPACVGYGKKNYIWFYFDEKVYRKLADEALEKLVADPSFVPKIILPEMMKAGESAEKIIVELDRKNYDLSSKEALIAFQELSNIVIDQIGYHFIAILDLLDFKFTNYLKNYLSDKIPESKLNWAMEKLLAPVHLTYSQKLELQMLKSARSKKTEGEIEKSLMSIAHKYEWIDYGYRGPAKDLDYFRDYFDRLRNVRSSQVESKIELIQNYRKNTSLEKTQLYKDLKIDSQHRKFIDSLSDLSFLKTYRKDIAFMSICGIYKILDKCSNGISKENRFYLTIEEAEDLIKGKKVPTSRKLTDREKESIYLSEGHRILTGDKARTFRKENCYNETDDLDLDVDFVSGTTASLGRKSIVTGRVRIVNKYKEIGKIEEGDILVSVATTPDILPAMKVAAAIVTDLGGITSHAAIVSRELKTTCVIGTRIATKVFKDGDLVEVDADKGIVRKLD